MINLIISILAANFAGNKGAAAMLQSSIKNISSKVEGVQYKLLSVYPEEDRAQNPYENLEVVSCKPEKTIFLAFPLAILYRIFHWVKPLRQLFLTNNILKAIDASDLILDEAGISFVDSRGFVMNTYNFICMAIPLLLGKPVVKYSQAMGPFNKFCNRTLAKLVLPRLKRIGARGNVTKAYLDELGLKNTVLCADGAFLMLDDPNEKNRVQEITKGDTFYNGKVISLSISSVVEKYCEKIGIDYKGIMVDFIDYLIDKKGYGVLIMANAARKGKGGRKNNDLHVCQAVFDLVKNREGCRWYNEEFTPEAIREFIALSQLMVASRFHAMIGALYKKVPVLLVGWSHKYKEVLDMFSLGQNAVDYKKLNLQDLIDTFNVFEDNQDEIRRNIESHLEDVQASSALNHQMVIDELRRTKCH